MMHFLQMYNEMYLQTTSALSNTSPAMDESISRLHVETSNTPLNKSLNVSDSSVSSPHSDSEKRSVHLFFNATFRLLQSFTGSTQYITMYQYTSDIF